MRTPLPRWFVLLLASGLGGCGASTTVLEGKVTYNNEEIEKGWIAFLPADGKAATAGAAIENGRYKIAGLPPGKRIVEITSTKIIEWPKTLSEDQDELEKKPNERGFVVPPDAVGNHQEIEISGSQELNFALKSPAPGP